MLADALTAVGTAFAGGADEESRARGDVIAALLARLDDTTDCNGVEPLCDALLAVTSTIDASRNAALADVLGTVARRLAPDDEPPLQPASRAAWSVLLAMVDRLGGAGVAVLGRLPFISEHLLDLLVAEARLELPDRPESGQRVVAAPGRALASLAVSPRLARAVEAALGVDVVPAGRAVYLYDPPGSHVRTHLDTRAYELVVHMTLEHNPPGDGSPRSALVAHLPGRAEPTRIWLDCGEAVALRGRGTIHSWQELGSDERRTLIGIGFRCA